MLARYHQDISSADSRDVSMKRKCCFRFNKAGMLKRHYVLGHLVGLSDTADHVFTLFIIYLDTQHATTKKTDEFVALS